MQNVFNNLENIFISRPHKHKCTLISFLNFKFIEFNIMYKNYGIIQMDKYRTNNINNCYCFCRESYSDNSSSEQIPDMIGCDECQEWYHAECVMLDEKQMKKFLNTKKTKFICPRCCYYEYNDYYKYFKSLHWKCDLIQINDIYNILLPKKNNIILCNDEKINGINRLLLWIKSWQNDVNKFINIILKSHKILSDFTESEIFITQYLLNCGEISSIATLELYILKILMRFIGKSAIWNNHQGIRQLNLHELPLNIIENKLLPKYENNNNNNNNIYKNKLIIDFIKSIINDIKNCKELLYECYIDIYLIRSIGIHYTTHMRRKKKGPYRVKLILEQLNHILLLEINQCNKILINKKLLDNEGDEYVTAQFENDNRWLKYVNDSISMRKQDLKMLKDKIL